MQYATIEDVEEYGGFTNPTEAERAMLDTLISAASKMIDDECNRVFGVPPDAVTVAKTFTADNGLLPGTGLLPDSGRTLYLDDDLYDVVSIPTLPVGTTLTYLPDHPPYYALVRSEGAWEDPTTIVGNWAYSNTPPVSIVNETCRLTCALHFQRQGQNAGENRSPFGPPHPDKRILSHYRRIKLP